MCYIIISHILAFAFLPQKDSYYVHDDSDAFFIFLLQKDFGTFHMLLFEIFLYVFDNSCLPFLYIEENCIKNFISFFICLKINFKI